MPADFRGAVAANRMAYSSQAARGVEAVDCGLTINFLSPIMDLQSLSLQVPHRTLTSSASEFLDVFASTSETQSPSTEQYLYKVAKGLPAGYRKPLLELLPTIYKGFEAGDHCALYHSLHIEAPETITRLRRVFDAYEVPWIEPGFVYTPHSRRRKCSSGMEGIQRMLADLKRLGPNFDPDQVVNHFAQEVKDLKTSCKKLEYLLRTGRSSPALRDRVVNLLESLKRSPAMDLDLLEGVDDFTRLYFEFCALSLTGQDTGGKIRELRQLVKGKLEKATHEMEKFDRVSKMYAEGGRQDLASIMQENAKTARKAGFREGVSSAAESQQIYDDLEKIDKGFMTIGQRLKDSKEFWEGVDRKLNSAPYTLTGQNIKDHPDGSRTESVAQKIQTGLETVHGAAQQYSGSPKILKAGTQLVRRASDLTKDCTTIARTQLSAQTHLQNSTSNPTSGRKVLLPLTKGFGSLAKRYEKISQEFAKWARWIYLLFWFAGSAPADKLRMERPDHVAHAVLLSKGLPSYLLPFESSLTAIERHLRGIQKLWMNLELMGDGIPRPAWEIIRIGTLMKIKPDDWRNEQWTQPHSKAV
ncbi:hypothetical protein FB451DRAFT_1239481 [Mycena latifolia]|nr:hypothetical protein FB451DRAFT_1239481 [Mycena latifolia]